MSEHVLPQAAGPPVPTPDRSASPVRLDDNLRKAIEDQRQMLCQARAILQVILPQLLKLERDPAGPDILGAAQLALRFVDTAVDALKCPELQTSTDDAGRAPSLRARLLVTLRRTFAQRS